MLVLKISSVSGCRVLCGSLDLRPALYDLGYVVNDNDETLTWSTRGETGPLFVAVLRLALSQGFVLTSSCSNHIARNSTFVLRHLPAAGGLRHLLEHY